jgi:hypothetical protein
MSGFIDFSKLHEVVCNGKSKLEKHHGGRKYNRDGASSNGSARSN